MNVLYHLTSPLPPVAGTDAVVQEVDALRGRFGCRVNLLYPFRRPGLPWPRILYGLHRLPALRREEEGLDLHHVYGPDLYVHPVLRVLRRPVVYTVTTSLDGIARAPSRRALEAIHTVVVSNARDLATVRSWGVARAVLIRPGIDLARFRPVPSRLPGGALRLLSGSAPWTTSQFRLKGVDALMEAAVRLPALSLVFLWRGLLLDSMRKSVARLGLEQRVEIISDRVDVAEVLARVDAAVVLSEHATLVKAFPHSLLEALAMGKPVLVSRTIPMADYVIDVGCGLVVDRVTGTDVVTAVEELAACYEELRARAVAVGAEAFSRDAMVTAYGALYADVMATPHRTRPDA